MPSDRAASMFWARSSMKRQSPGLSPNRARARSKYSGSGFMTPSNEDINQPSNQLRKSYSWSRRCQLSFSMLLSA